MKDQSTAEAPSEPDENEGGATSPDGQSEPLSEGGLPRMLNDRYRLERLIAKGGMGRVYLATQLPLERKVALKNLVRPTLNDDFRRRFFLEASVLAQLSHPNIVVVHDYGEALDGSLFMAMEYLDGVTLLDTLRREGRLKAKRAVEITIQVCRALRSAHRQGVAHRDLKPGNIMLLRDAETVGDEAPRDIVKVLDFGLVKFFEEDKVKALERDLTHSEMMLGSPRYMAPEQIRSGSVDARTDVYSMGVVFFAMLTGRPPFVGTTLEILNQHIECPPPGLNELTQRLKGFDAVDPEHEPTLNAIVQRCLHKDPEARFQSMDELLIDLRTAYRLFLGDAIEGSSMLDITHPTVTPLPASKPPSTPAPTSVGPGDDSEETSHERLRAVVPQGIPTEPVPLTLAATATTPRSSRGLLAIIGVVAIGGLVAVAAGLAWALWPTPGPSASSAPVLPDAVDQTRPATQGAVTAAPADAVVSFTSSPPGAKILLDDRLIGTTPVQRPLEATTDGHETAFRFILDGYQPLTVRAVISGASPSVHADLVAMRSNEEPNESHAKTSRGTKRRGDHAQAKAHRSPIADTGGARGRNATKHDQPAERDTGSDSHQPAKVDDTPRRLIIDEPTGTVPIVD